MRNIGKELNLLKMMGMEGTDLLVVTQCSSERLVQLGEICCQHFEGQIEGKPKDQDNSAHIPLVTTRLNNNQSSSMA
jgi:hypothetical protein